MLSLKDELGNSIRHQLFENEEICYNEWLEMRVPIIKNSKNQRYVINILTLKIEEVSEVGVYKIEEIIDNELLLCNKVKGNGVLSHRVLYN